MRQPLGDRLARQASGHPDRSARPRLEHAMREDDSTPACRARMIEEALEKLGVGPVVLVVHSWAGALGARMALDYPARVAGLVMLAPVAYPWTGGVGWYNELVTKPVIGPLLAYTVTLPLGYFLAGRGRAQRLSAADHAGRFRRRYRDAAVAASARVPRQCPRSRDVEAGGQRAGAALCGNQGADGGDFRRRRQDGVDEHPFPPVCRCGPWRNSSCCRASVTWCRTPRRTS